MVLWVQSLTERGTQLLGVCGETRDGTRRRQETVGQEKQNSILKEGRKSHKTEHRKEEKHVFFSYLSIFSDIQYIFEGTWLNRNTGMGGQGQREIEKEIPEL